MIRGQIMIERRLDSLLSKTLTGYKVLLGRHWVYFDLEVDLCLCSNLISDKPSDALYTLNRIRNKLSYEKNPEIPEYEIRKLKTGFYKEPMFQKALGLVDKKGYEDALMLSTLFLYWEISRLVTQSKSA